MLNSPEEMDLRTILSGGISKSFVKSVAEQVITDPHAFDTLYRLIHDDDRTVSWRAAWVCAAICGQHPEWLMDKRDELMRLAIQSSNHSLLRETLSILLMLPVATPLSVEFLNCCLDRMVAPDVPIAIQALSIKLVYEMALTEPELLPEITICLESMEPEFYSSGVQAVLRNTLKKIRKRKR